MVQFSQVPIASLVQYSGNFVSNNLVLIPVCLILVISAVVISVPSLSSILNPGEPGLHCTHQNTTCTCRGFALADTSEVEKIF